MSRNEECMYIGFFNEFPLVGTTSILYVGFFGTKVLKGAQNSENFHSVDQL